MHIIQGRLQRRRVISVNTRNLLKYVSQDYFSDTDLIQFFSLIFFNKEKKIILKYLEKMLLYTPSGQCIV